MIHSTSAAGVAVPAPPPEHAEVPTETVDAARSRTHHVASDHTATTDGVGAGASAGAGAGAGAGPGAGAGAGAGAGPGVGSAHNTNPVGSSSSGHLEHQVDAPMNLALAGAIVAAGGTLLVLGVRWCSAVVGCCRCWNVHVGTKQFCLVFFV